jgi:hypothetical protein
MAKSLPISGLTLSLIENLKPQVVIENDLEILEIA